MLCSQGHLEGQVLSKKPAQGSMVDVYYNLFCFPIQPNLNIGDITIEVSPRVGELSPTDCQQPALVPFHLHMIIRQQNMYMT